MKLIEKKSIKGKIYMGNNMFNISYFYSPTCSICDRQKEILGQLAAEDDISFEDYNIFTDLDKALSLGVHSAPAMAIIYENKSVEILTGFQELKTIRERLSHWLSVVA